ncbi:hypothetical protein RHGRI_007027 [Rhododendron griersonianum]|uniref:Uncharacterized protein n=1 Tax=Rhododendron griersonianum TaxID=479676 RepID=A0AAV6KVR0_9ERIC|nr:hypothetical protein RHGRI_007027 [Rhododendron griersonianum]
MILSTATMEGGGRERLRTTLEFGNMITLVDLDARGLVVDARKSPKSQDRNPFELKSGVATSSFEVITSFDSLTISISLLIPSLPIPVHIRLRLYVSPSIWASGPRNRPHMGHRPGPIGWAIRLGPVRLGLGPICPQPQRPPVRVGRVGVGAG